jgi:hypothetical protein
MHRATRRNGEWGSDLLFSSACNLPHRGGCAGLARRSDRRAAVPGPRIARLAVGERGKPRCRRRALSGSAPPATVCKCSLCFGVPSSSPPALRARRTSATSSSSTSPSTSTPPAPFTGPSPSPLPSLPTLTPRPRPSRASVPASAAMRLLLLLPPLLFLLILLLLLLFLLLQLVAGGMPHLLVADMVGVVCLLSLTCIIHAYMFWRRELPLLPCRTRC